MAAGDVVNTAARLQSAAAGERRSSSASRPCARPSGRSTTASRAGRGEGKAQPGAGVGGGRGRGRGSASSASTARRSSAGSARSPCSRTRSPACRQERRAQLVTVVGVPGIGKSRLVLELYETIERRPELISWRQGRCLPVRRGRHVLGARRDGQGAGRDPRGGRAGRGGAEARARSPAIRGSSRTCARSSGSPAPPRAAGDMRDEAFAAWRRFFEGLAEERPARARLRGPPLGGRRPARLRRPPRRLGGGVPLLVVCTARPELLDRRPGWGGGKPNALTISLSPLSDEDTARLLAELLGSASCRRRRRPSCSRAPAAIRCTPRSSRACSRDGAGSARAAGDGPGPDRGAARPARADAEAARSRTRRSIGRRFWLGALARCRRLEPLSSRRGCTPSSARSSSAASASARRSTTSRVRVPRTCSSATSPTAQIPRAERAEKHLLAAGGSRRSAAARTTPRCSRTTTCRRSS